MQRLLTDPDGLQPVSNSLSSSERKRFRLPWKNLKLPQGCLRTRWEARALTQQSLTPAALTHRGASIHNTLRERGRQHAGDPWETWLEEKGPPLETTGKVLTTF